MSNVTHVTTDRFEEEVLRAGQPVLVDFYAPWCGPCRVLAPILEKLAGEHAGRARIVKVDVDQERDLASRYGITGVPTVMLFEGGESTYSFVGLPRPQELANVLANAAGAGTTR